MEQMCGQSVIDSHQQSTAVGVFLSKHISLPISDLLNKQLLNNMCYFLNDQLFISCQTCLCIFIYIDLDSSTLFWVHISGLSV